MTFTSHSPVAAGKWTRPYAGIGEQLHTPPNFITSQPPKPILYILLTHTCTLSALTVLSLYHFAIDMLHDASNWTTILCPEYVSVLKMRLRLLCVTLQGDSISFTNFFCRIEGRTEVHSNHTSRASWDSQVTDEHSDHFGCLTTKYNHNVIITTIIRAALVCSRGG